jgi:hypothetical protein
VVQCKCYGTRRCSPGKPQRCTSRRSCPRVPGCHFTPHNAHRLHGRRGILGTHDAGLSGVGYSFWAWRRSGGRQHDEVKVPALSGDRQRVSNVN